jgi:hypothetical protein
MFYNTRLWAQSYKDFLYLINEFAYYAEVFVIQHWKSLTVTNTLS